MNRIVPFSFILLCPVYTLAAVYKCEVDGQVSFSDEPCGDSSERVHVDAPGRSGMRLDRGTDFRSYQPLKTKKARSKPEPCPYINSTDLKALIIREQVKTGMKPRDVRKSWGNPSSIHKSSNRVQWSYHWPNGNANYVYFKGGCVSDFSSYQRNY